MIRLKNLSFRTKFSLVAAIFMVFGVAGAVLISQQQQEVRSRAYTDITGDFPGDLVGDDFRVAGKVLGNVIGNRNQISNGVQGGIYGNDNSIKGDVGGCINGNNTRVTGNVAGGVVGTNNIVLGTKGTGDCPLPGTVTSAPTAIPTSVPPTATTIPTATSTPVPSATPTSVPPTSTPTSVPPTATPTPTPIPPTPTSVPVGNTTFSFNILLHGIGQGGDSANPAGGGNPNPLHPQRELTVEVLNDQNQLVLTKKGIISFGSTAGNFTGTIDMGTTLTSGTYTIKVKANQFLRRIIPGMQNITAGALNQLAQATLINGDIDNSNSLSILDYNILIGCYSDFLLPVSCTPENKIRADIDDDGAVNQYDYNLFLRELNNIQGQ